MAIPMRDLMWTVPPEWIGTLCAQDYSQLCLMNCRCTFTSLDHNNSWIVQVLTTIYRAVHEQDCFFLICWCAGEFKVDLFIAGHLHNYERSYPVNNGTVASTSYHNPRDTVHAVVGMAGCNEGAAMHCVWSTKVGALFRAVSRCLYVVHG